VIALSWLRLVHLNDSKDGFGSPCMCVRVRLVDYYLIRFCQVLLVFEHDPLYERAGSKHSSRVLELFAASSLRFRSFLSRLLESKRDSQK